MEESLSDVHLLRALSQRDLIDGGADEMTQWEERTGMEAPHPCLLSSTDRKRPEAYTQRQLNGFWLKHLGWERLREPWWPYNGSYWLGLPD